MQIVNSLKNKNVKKHLIISLITVITVTIASISILLFVQQKNIEQVLTKYEVLKLSESLALEEIYSQTYSFFYITIGVTFVMLLLVILYFFLALNRNEKDTKNIRKYLAEIANKNYKFDIENMSESEMSNLKSEIYKIVLELKEKTENLAKDRQTLSNYLADISHQIRTPLMAISSMVDAIIENENRLDESTRKFIYKISKQLDQINWLVDNLLKMAQLDTKTVIFNKENINLKTFVEKVENNMSVFLELKNQKIIFNIDEKIKINIDIKWTTEAIENIVSNEHQLDYNYHITIQYQEGKYENLLENIIDDIQESKIADMVISEEKSNFSILVDINDISEPEKEFSRKLYGKDCRLLAHFKSIFASDKFDYDDVLSIHYISIPIITLNEDAYNIYLKEIGVDKLESNECILVDYVNEKTKYYNGIRLTNYQDGDEIILKNNDVSYNSTFALILGISLGLAVSNVIYLTSIDYMWYAFEIPWLSIVFSTIGIILVILISTIYLKKKIFTNNLIEVLKEEDI